MQDALLDQTTSSQPAPAERAAVEPRLAEPHSAEVQPAEVQPALPFRADTILGVCEAIGEEFGFHPNWLRVVFAAAVLWDPPVVIGIYLAIGVAVAIARYLYPKPAAAAGAASAYPTAEHHPANADRKPERLAA